MIKPWIFQESVFVQITARFQQKKFEFRKLVKATMSNNNLKYILVFVKLNLLVGNCKIPTFSMSSGSFSFGCFRLLMTKRFNEFFAAKNQSNTRALRISYNLLYIKQNKKFWWPSDLTSFFLPPKIKVTRALNEFLKNLIKTTKLQIWREFSSNLIKSTAKLLHKTLNQTFCFQNMSLWKLFSCKS